MDIDFPKPKISLRQAASGNPEPYLQKNCPEQPLELLRAESFAAGNGNQFSFSASLRHVARRMSAVFMENGFERGVGS